MPSAEPVRLTDDLWLAAHDSVSGRPQIGDWPLGVGLATGLLAELIHTGFVELRHGELFRTTAEAPDDVALRPLMIQMEIEERSWSRTPKAAGTSWDATPQTQHGQDWPAHAQNGPGRPALAQHGRSWRPPSSPEEDRHQRRGHELGAWMSYLAYENRAENRVIERLARLGLVRREVRRRLLGGTTVRYVPYDSVTSGRSANSISSAVQLGRELPPPQLFLAGLFLATGLHHHALATLSPYERSLLGKRLGQGLDAMSRELLKAADAAVGDAAMR